MQLVGKRKMEIAEETLVLAYKVRAALVFVRLPVAKPGEGVLRTCEIREPTGFEKLRNSYFVPTERLRDYEDDFGRLERQKLLCEAYFGPEAGKPLAELTSMRLRILEASRGLLMLAQDRPLEPREVARVAEGEEMIWGFGELGDRLLERRLTRR